MATISRHGAPSNACLTITSNTCGRTPRAIVWRLFLSSLSFYQVWEIQTTPLLFHHRVQEAMWEAHLALVLRDF